MSRMILGVLLMALVAIGSLGSLPVSAQAQQGQMYVGCTVGAIGEWPGQKEIEVAPGQYVNFGWVTPPMITYDPQLTIHEAPDCWADWDGSGFPTAPQEPTGRFHGPVQLGPFMSGQYERNLTCMSRQGQIAECKTTITVVEGHRTFCTKDLGICSDGSKVVRELPGCGFAACKIGVAVSERLFAPATTLQ